MLSSFKKYFLVSLTSSPSNTGRPLQPQNDPRLVWFVPGRWRPHPVPRGQQDFSHRRRPGPHRLHRLLDLALGLFRRDAGHPQAEVHDLHQRDPQLVRGRVRPHWDLWIRVAYGWSPNLFCVPLILKWKDSGELILPRLERPRTIKLARFSLVLLNEETQYTRDHSISFMPLKASSTAIFFRFDRNVNLILSLISCYENILIEGADCYTILVEWGRTYQGERTIRSNRELHIMYWTDFRRLTGHIEPNVFENIPLAYKLIYYWNCLRRYRSWIRIALCETYNIKIKTKLSKFPSDLSFLRRVTSFWNVLWKPWGAEHLGFGGWCHVLTRMGIFEIDIWNCTCNTLRYVTYLTKICVGFYPSSAKHMISKSLLNAFLFNLL